jgi:hypothetical protein
LSSHSGTCAWQATFTPICIKKQGTFECPEFRQTIGKMKAPRMTLLNKPRFEMEFRLLETFKANKEMISFQSGEKISDAKNGRDSAQQ